MSLTRYTFSWALVLCGASSSLIAQTPTTAKKSPGAIVSGTVTIKGKAAPGIVVGLRVAQPATPYELTHKGTTDQDGKYRIGDLASGSYSVAPVAPSFVQGYQTVVLTEGESVEGINFALVRGGVITGKVTDADGGPVVEQSVSLIVAEQATNPRMPNYSFNVVQTDDRGIYRMFGLAAGRYRVTAGQGSGNVFMSASNSPSYTQTFHPDVTDVAKATVVEVTEGSEAGNVDIALGRASQTHAASGRVINGQSGQPIAGVRFRLQAKVDALRRPFMSTSAISNSRGEFKIESLPPGTYSINIQPQADSDIRAEAVIFEVLDHDVTELVIKSSPGMTIAGTIVLENTKDQAVLDKLLQLNIQGAVQSDAATQNMVHSASISPDGSFFLKGLEAGKAFLYLGVRRDPALLKGFTITRTERDGVVQPRGLEIREGDQVSGVRVVVSYGNATVRGVVKVENGTLPAAAHLFVQISRTGERLSAIRPPQLDARGHFIVEGIPAGSYDVSVMVGGLQPAPPGTRPPTTKQQVNVIEGVVNDVTIILDLSQWSGPPSP